MIAALCFTSCAASDETSNVTEILGKDLQDEVLEDEKDSLPFDRAPIEPWNEGDPLAIDFSQLVEVEMDSQDDSRSMVSTAASLSSVVLGKRKIDTDERDEMSEGGTVRAKLRPCNAKVKKSQLSKQDNVISGIKSKDKLAHSQTQVHSQAPVPATNAEGAGNGGVFLPQVKESDDAFSMLTTSEGEERKKDSDTRKKIKYKWGKSRRNGPTIESQLREVPSNLNEFSITSASQLGASALEWLDDINVIRVGRGNLQGGLQSQMKKRVTAIKEIVRVMVEKVEDICDPGYLRRRNAELIAEVKVSKKETEMLRRDLTDLQRVVEDLKTKITAQDDKASSPLPPICGCNVT